MATALTKQEVDKLFSDDRYIGTSSETLNRAMQHLVNNTSVDNNTVIRALVINTVINDRHYKKIERLNLFLTIIIIILTTASIIVPIWISNKSQAVTETSKQYIPKPLKQDNFMVKEKK